MRCTTTHGQYRCDYEQGHTGECEAKVGPSARPIDLDAQRELRRAAKKLARIAEALEASDDCVACRVIRAILVQP